MTKGKKTNKVRPTRNPLFRRVSKIARPKVAFDGTNLQCTQYTASFSVDEGENIGWGRLRVDASGDDSVAASMVSVTQAYNEYRYQSCTLSFEPSTGPADAEARARIHIAYIDNPEKYINFLSLSNANRLLAIRGVKNARCYNAWERFTYNVPLTYKRKWFDVNLNTAETVDVLDRSTQGFVLFVVQSDAIDAESHGVWRIQSNITLHGLDLQIGT